MTASLFTRRQCNFSSDRLYRFTLRIIWDASKPVQMFVGLNPSTADEENDDPTVRRWIGFAQDWGKGGIIICNAFAYRSTDWTVLKRVPDPIGERNDMHLAMAVIAADGMPIACWGANAAKIDAGRADKISKLLRMDCFGTNADGSPQHPLYLRADTKPRPWNY